MQGVGDPTLDPGTGRRRDYYELLGLEGWPGDQEARKAYYRAAMQMHPDRHREPEAKERADRLFKYLQEAWTTLSDPRERAYYDRNKASVLSVAPEEDEFFGVDTFVNLRAYRRPSCYSGFGDGPGAFFAVYAALFEALAREEARAAQGRLDRGSFSAPERAVLESRASGEAAFPQFGDSLQAEGGISRFYAFWASFTTVKEFAHNDLYDAKGENAKIRRLTARENERLRRDGRERFSEQVRDLAAYVRRRDPRPAVFEERRAERDATQAREQREAEEERKRARKEEAQRLREETAGRVAELRAKLAGGTLTPGEMRELESLAVTGQTEADRIAKSMDRELAGIRERRKKPDVSPRCTAEVPETPRDLADQGLRWDAVGARLYCSGCNQRCATEGEFRTHLSSKRHRKAVEEPDEPPKPQQAPRKPRRGQKGKEDDPEPEEAGPKCRVCGATFQSRTKLFAHLEESGHASVKPR